MAKYDHFFQGHDRNIFNESVSCRLRLVMRVYKLVFYPVQQKCLELKFFQCELIQGCSWVVLNQCVLSSVLCAVHQTVEGLVESVQR